MGISSSTMMCPSCMDQMLETLSTSFGAWDRCPSCRGIFIHRDLLAAASPDPAKCKEALEEMQALLLPTERSCPSVFQKLFDGRVRSRGVIFSLCPTDQSFWTSLPVLQQFEEAIEKNINRPGGACRRGQHAGVLSGTLGQPPDDGSPKSVNDSVLGSLFRVVARIFDRVADNFSRSPKEASSKPEKKAKAASQAKAPKPGKLIQSVEPLLPTEPVQPVQAAQPPDVKPIEPFEEAPRN